MIRLPKLCGPVALACSKDSARYSMQSVHVQEFQDDGYRIEATDGHILAVLRGQSNQSTPYQQMFSVANDLWDYLVPADKWTEWFKRIDKDGTLGLAAEKIDPRHREEGEGTCRVVLTDGEMMQSLSPDDRLFPPIESVLPKEPALFSICFTPALFIRLLTIAERIQELAGMENREAHLLFWGEGKGVGICFRSKSGEVFDGIIMPLSGVYAPPTVDDAIDVPDDDASEEPTLAEPQTAPPVEEAPAPAPEERPTSPEVNGYVDTVQAPPPKTKKPRKPWFRKKKGGDDAQGE